MELAMAAKLHAEAAAALLEATVQLEGALMMSAPDGRRRAGERYDEARLREAQSLTELVRTRRAQARPLLSILADPTMSCDADASVLASIVDYAAATPASAGVELRRTTTGVFADVRAKVTGGTWSTIAGAAAGSADRRYGFPLTASR